jgi:hypothetical protein
MLKPLRMPVSAETKAGDQVLLCSIEGEDIHCLNATAHLIWTLCDGEHTVEDLETALRANFAIPEGVDLQTDVTRTLEMLAAKKLVHESASSDRTAKS